MVWRFKSSSGQYLQIGSLKEAHWVRLWVPLRAEKAASRVTERERMPRHTGPFQLVFREDRGLYYARFRDDDELLPWRSTGLVSKTAARAWAQKEIKKGSVTSTRATFAKYAEDWWTTDHPHVQGRLARGHKLTATYLVMMRGHLANHVLRTSRTSGSRRSAPGRSRAGYS
jgi:hypothetical protein